MTLSVFIHFALASTYVLLAWRVWWRGMPPVMVVRGRWHGLVTWLLGMAMACFANSYLDLAVHGTTANYMMVAGDVCLMSYVFGWLFRIRRLGDYKWGVSPAT